MLGQPKPRRLDAPIAVSLEDLVPADTFYRHWEAKLDLASVWEWRERCPPTKAARASTLWCSSKAFAPSASSSRPPGCTWPTAGSLGYALDEELPDLSRLTRIRQRLGIEIFARFFEKVDDLCQEAGLV